MGIFSGDVTVPQFPANFRVAFYAEYLPKEGIGSHDIQATIIFGDVEAVKATISIPEHYSEVVNIVIQQGIAKFEKPGEIIWKLEVQNETFEVLRKHVMLAKQEATTT